MGILTFDFWTCLLQTFQKKMVEDTTESNK